MFLFLFNGMFWNDFTLHKSCHFGERSTCVGVLLAQSYASIEFSLFPFYFFTASFRFAGDGFQFYYSQLISKDYGRIGGMCVKDGVFLSSCFEWVDKVESLAVR